MDTRDIGGQFDVEREKQREEFKKFLDELSGKIHGLTESKPQEERYSSDFHIEIRELIRQEVFKHPPYFYTTDGRPDESFSGIRGTHEKIVDKDLALDIARLGEIYYADTTVIEWNKKDYQKIFLATHIPNAADKQFHDYLIYSEVSLETAQYLVDNNGIRTELGRMGNEEWWNDETGEYESEPAENFTVPRLKENLHK